MNRKISIQSKIVIGYLLLVAILGIAVGATMYKVQEIQRASDDLVTKKAPMTLAGADLLSGLNDGLAEDYEVTLLGDDGSKPLWEGAWKNSVIPQLNRLKELATDQDDRERLPAIEQKLQDLYALQVSLQKTARNPNNEPAVRLLVMQDEPIASDAINGVKEMIDEETQAGGPARVPVIVALSNLSIALSVAETGLHKYLISPNPESKSSFYEHLKKTEDAVHALGGLGQTLSRTQVARLEEIRTDCRTFGEQAKKIIETRDSPEWNQALYRLKNELGPKADEATQLVEKTIASERKDLGTGSDKLLSMVQQLAELEWFLLTIGIVLSVCLGALITRTISKKLTSETSQLKASSSELKAAASEQLSGVTEQTAATAEVSTTMKEFVTMTKMIVERAEQVTEFVNNAVERCSDGQSSVNDAQTIVIEIKSQVEKIVELMVDLGGKSQKITIALDIIRELSEQTTILSYNAAIEAASAGEAGQGFAVVADQVGKLADRAKEASRVVRSLIEEVQKSTNTTIMATEDALKAADRGLAAQNQASITMKGVVGEISKSLEAVREIGMASSQQSVAAEQVKCGVDNILVASKDTQKRAEQVLGTAKLLQSTAEVLETM